MINSLKHKFDIFNDDVFNEYEDFRDHLTDHGISPSIAIGQKVSLGNECEIVVVSHDVIEDQDKSQELRDYLAENSDRFEDPTRCIHSQYILNTQAERDIKIDILWVESVDDFDEHETHVIAMYFEDNGEGSFDETPNFVPANNPYWNEILCDMGLQEDFFDDD